MLVMTFEVIGSAINQCIDEILPVLFFFVCTCYLCVYLLSTCFMDVQFNWIMLDSI